jgi:hypothetical protein
MLAEGVCCRSVVESYSDLRREKEGEKRML